MTIMGLKLDTAPSASDQVATERVTGNIVIRTRKPIEDCLVTPAAGGSAVALKNFMDRLTSTEAALLDQDANATNVGAVAQPASGTVACTIERLGSFFTLKFTLTSARITVTDGAGSGSHGSLKIFNFVQSGVQYLACRQNYTAFAEGALLTGAAGDAAFVMGVGSVAVAAAADGLLETTSVDIGSSTSTITLSSGTGTGTKHNASTANIDGTGTAATINLNWSGSADTIDATSTIDVTGTITVVGVMTGDD